MSEKLNIEELVRSSLGEAELTPSQGTWTGIMRKLRWRQFLRFHPARFNIYYAGAILLATTGLILVLSKKETVPEPVNIQRESVTNSPVEVKQVEPALESKAEEREETRSTAMREPEMGEKEDVMPAAETEPGISEPATKEDSRKITEAAPGLAKMSPIKKESIGEPQPFTYFASSVESGCAPLEVHFSNQSKNASSYKWAFGTGEESNELDPVYVFKEPGRFMVTLTAENHDGNATVSRRLIEVLPKPVADFRIEEGLEGTDNHVVLNLLNYSSSAASYSWCLIDDQGINCSQWSSPEFQPSLNLNRLTPSSRSVQLEVISEHGCRDTVSMELPLKVESSEVKIKFATAFSPNPSGPGDGSFTPQSKRIDLFHPIYMEVPVEFRMRIFTRRGELVFETQEVYRGWDGYIHQEQAPADVYVWMVEGRWADGQPFSYHGDVTLVRNKYW